MHDDITVIAIFLEMDTAGQTVPDPHLSFGRHIDITGASRFHISRVKDGQRIFAELRPFEFAKT